MIGTVICETWFFKNVFNYFLHVNMRFKNEEKDSKDSKKNCFKKCRVNNLCNVCELGVESRDLHYR